VATHIEVYIQTSYHYLEDKKKNKLLKWRQRTPSKWQSGHGQWAHEMQFLVQTGSHIAIRALVRCLCCPELSNWAGVTTQYTVFHNYMTVCSLLDFRPFGLLAALNLIWINATVRFTNTIFLSAHFFLSQLL